MSIGRRKVAVIGSGIAGLAAAWTLAPHASVTLFEAGNHFGGHTNTVDVTMNGITHGVDTGFLVFNHRTYPRLTQLFTTLGVETAPSAMSFSVQDLASGLQWSGSSLNSVFTQRRNLLRPSFLHMLAEIVRFNKLATALALASDEKTLDETIAAFLDREGFGRGFREHYFLPMLGCIWSCPTEHMLQFPVETMIRFCHNHGLIQLTDRPQWYTVRGGARQYVHLMLERITDARLRTPVLGVHRHPPGSDKVGANVRTAQGEEPFDEVVLACHTNQSLSLLADATAAERNVLGAIRYHANRAVLHSDICVMPSRRLAWAAWNYERAEKSSAVSPHVCLHYWINQLQPLPWSQPVMVSLNPIRPIDPARVIATFEYEHPVFDRAAISAQQKLAEIQGRAGLWFCGAWTRYGFHEDGLVSGCTVAEAMLKRWRASGVGDVASKAA